MARNSQVFALKVSARWLPRALTGMIRRSAEKLMGFPEFNSTYAGMAACTAAEFPQKFLEVMEVGVKVDGMGEEAIPATGPLIVVANHPFGSIEGIALDAMLLRRRGDVTMMCIYVFGAIPELHERYTFVDPARRRRKRKLNPQGWRQAFQWIARGGALGVFPAGRVARFQWRGMRVAEQPWSAHIQLAGMVHPRLTDVLFVREITNKRGRTLRATIGAVIGPERLVGFESDEEATEFLWRETEKLGKEKLKD